MNEEIKNVITGEIIMIIIGIAFFTISDSLLIKGYGFGLIVASISTIIQIKSNETRTKR